MVINEAIALLDTKLNNLQTEYEQYFLRIIKQEPLALRGEVERLIRACNSHPIHNTATKFKLNTISARYQTHKNYWTRIMRSIEDGTYHRDVFKLNLSNPQLPPLVQGTNVTPKVKKGSRLKTLYDEYIETRVRCREVVRGITFEKLKYVILQEAERAKERYGCNSVSYKVSVRDGKAKIVIVPAKRGQGRDD
ncbi:MAG: MXAN_5187 C-terminal domain-containing protein [Thermodesulfobacteriota bacterium]